MQPRQTTRDPMPPSELAPYRGPDRRGVARFVVPAALPTALLVLVAAACLLIGPNLRFKISEVALNEIAVVGATLALLAGVASILRWRLDGIARNWWCGWALLTFGTGRLVLEPLAGTDSLAVDLAIAILAGILILCAITGPEVDASIRLTSTVAVAAGGAALALAIVFAVDQSHVRPNVALASIGIAWLLIAALAASRQLGARRDIEAAWLIPLGVALGFANLVPLGIHHGAAAELADRSFELGASGLAGIGALGGLVRAAVHHRTRALREQIERERETANRQRVEESFADRLHEMRSTVVAIEGGVATWAPSVEAEPDAPAGSSTADALTAESTLRAALIAEIRRLRTLVNESPSASDVEAFDVAATLAPTVELHRAAGQTIRFETEGSTRALGRPDQIAQVLEGLLTNAAKYAPGTAVLVTARHELDEISVRVEDDGVGIDPEYWDLIFERGFRVDPDAPTTGNGLGLAVARSLVRSQDGDLWVETSPSGGCAFALSIPAAPALRIVPPHAEAHTVIPDDISPLIPMREAR